MTEERKTRVICEECVHLEKVKRTGLIRCSEKHIKIEDPIIPHFCSHYIEAPLESKEDEVHIRVTMTGVATATVYLDVPKEDVDDYESYATEAKVLADENPDIDWDIDEVEEVD